MANCFKQTVSHIFEDEKEDMEISGGSENERFNKKNTGWTDNVIVGNETTVEYYFKYMTIVTIQNNLSKFLLNHHF